MPVLPIPLILLEALPNIFSERNPTDILSNDALGLSFLLPNISSMKNEPTVFAPSTAPFLASPGSFLTPLLAPLTALDPAVLAAPSTLEPPVLTADENKDPNPILYLLFFALASSISLLRASV